MQEALLRAWSPLMQGQGHAGLCLALSSNSPAGGMQDGAWHQGPYVELPGCHWGSQAECDGRGHWHRRPALAHAPALCHKQPGHGIQGGLTRQVLGASMYTTTDGASRSGLRASSSLCTSCGWRSPSNADLRTAPKCIAVLYAYGATQMDTFVENSFNPNTPNSAGVYYGTLNMAVNGDPFYWYPANM